MNGTNGPAKKIWYFPDAYLPDYADGISHEAICILNTGGEEARVNLTLYFENMDPVEGFFTTCGASRTNHLRLDRIRDVNGVPIPVCVPYSIKLVSDVPVLCQYTRLDATRPSYSLMTTTGLSED